MKNSLVFQQGPHIRGKRKTFSMMVEFSIVLLILLACSIVFYLVKGGPSSDFSNTTYVLFILQNVGCSVGFAMAADVIWYFPYLFRKCKERNPVSNYFYKVTHSYSLVTGLILALMLPIGLEWWEIGLTSAVSIIVCKLFFGGFGSNIINPAVFGRVFAQLVFASHMNTYLGDWVPEGADSLISAGATIPGLVNGGNFLAANRITFFDMVLGNYYGAIGETFALVICILGLYLIVRGIIDWRVPVFYVLSLFFSYGVCFILAGATARIAFEDAARQVMMGGVLFGAMFCLTDPVTSPVNKAGRIVFALGAAILTMVFRLFTNAPEGVAYSILIMNLLTPLIDKFFGGRTLSNYKEAAVIIVMLAGVFAVGIGYGMCCQSEIILPTGMIANVREVL